MSNFKPFSQAVHQQFTSMSKHEIFVADVSGDDLFAAYLAAFPEGTNPVSANAPSMIALAVKISFVILAMLLQLLTVKL